VAFRVYVRKRFWLLPCSQKQVSWHIGGSPFVVESGDWGFVGWGGVISVCDSFVGVGLFVVEMCAYRFASVSSCNYNQMEVQQQQSNSSHDGRSKTTFVAPICNCREFAVLRTTTTVKNGGRQFWGCPKYKVRCIKLWFMKKNALVLIFWLSFCPIQSRSGVSMRCNFFRWCIEDTGDDKDRTIARQINKICSLEKRLKMSRKWIKMLLVGLCVVINILMLTIFLKFPWVTSMYILVGIMIEWVNVICTSVLSLLCPLCNMYPKICINAKWILMNEIFDVLTDTGCILNSRSFSKW